MKALRFLSLATIGILFFASSLAVVAYSFGFDMPFAYAVVAESTAPFLFVASIAAFILIGGKHFRQAINSFLALVSARTNSPLMRC